MRAPFKICTVVEGNSLPVFLRNLKNAQEGSAKVELRADSIHGFEEDDIDTIRKNVSISSIFTCRHVKEGGLFSGDAKEQKAINKKAFHTSFSYVDVTVGNSLVKELDEKERKKLLLSYHDFEATPNYINLSVMLDRMRKEEPAIIKIATMVTSPKDVFALADVLKERKDKEKLIVIGMGEMGKLTRIMFPAMGSYMTYASMEGSKMAPGLMTRKQIESIYTTITKS